MRNQAGQRCRHGVVAAVATFVLAVSGCAAPAAGPPITREAATHPIVTTAPPAQSPDFTPVTLGRGQSVRGSWEDGTVTAQFCGVTGPVPYVENGARVRSSLYSEVDLFIDWPRYGRLADLGEVVALHVTCNNTGGTAAGNLGGADVIIAVRDGSLVAIAEITPQAELGDRPGSLANLRFAGDTVVAFEVWYRGEDATCCPSGRAETTWTYRDGTLTPGLPYVY